MCAITFQLASTCCDKLQYKIKINYITLKCTHTHTHTHSLSLSSTYHSKSRNCTTAQEHTLCYTNVKFTHL
jgi:hypothetical protein